MKFDELVLRTEAKQQVMTALLHCLCATHPARADVAKAFAGRMQALSLMWSSMPAEFPDLFRDAAEAARLSFAAALQDQESPATH